MEYMKQVKERVMKEREIIIQAELPRPAREELGAEDYSERRRSVYISQKI